MAQGFWRVREASGREFGAKPVRYCSGGHVTVLARSAPAAGLGGLFLAFLRAARFCACGFLVVLAILTVAGVAAARAVEAVNVRTDAVDLQHTEGDRIQVSTAPGADAIVRRIEVRAREAGKNWAVFALANNGDEQIDRLIVAPHYRMVGSGLIWPDLGRSRIVYITPSS